MQKQSRWITEYLNSLEFGGRNFKACGGRCVEIRNCPIMMKRLEKAHCKSKKRKQKIWKNVKSMVSSLTLFELNIIFFLGM